MHCQFTIFGIIISILAGLMFGASSAFADDPATYTTYDSSIDTGFNKYRPDSELHADIGAWLVSYSYAMESCSPSSRTVLITTNATRLSNPFVDFLGGLGLDEAFREAIVFAWHECPLAAHDNGNAYTVDSARIVLSNGQELARGEDFHLASVDPYGQPHQAYRFGKIVNSMAVARDTQAAADWALFFHRAYLCIKLALAAIAAYIGLRILYTVRDWPSAIFEGLLRAYYSLTPHPASDMVHAAVRAGVELDGDAFTEILRPIPGSRIAREVRADQARALAGLAERSANDLRRHADRLRASMREQAAYQAAQQELHDSTVDQQLARMRMEAFAKIDAFLKRRPTT